MQLRGWLVVAFSTLSLCIIIIFGYMAHRTSQEARLNAEYSFIQQRLQTLSWLLRQETSVTEEVLPPIPGQVPDSLIDSDEFLVIQNRQGTVRTLGNPPAGWQKAATHLDPADDTSLVSIDNQQYLTSTTSLDNGLRLSLHRLVSNRLEVFKGYSAWSRFIVAALLTLWLAIWGALILAAWISRQLDRQNKQLFYHAMHDSLTGLPNRLMLRQELERIINQPPGPLVALYILDIERFQELNDTLGHAYGDDLLKKIGERLSRNRLPYELMARMGSDEFGIIALHDRQEQIKEFAEQINRQLERPVSFDKIQFHTKLNIGVAVFPEHGEETNSLIQNAEVALYRAKSLKQPLILYKHEDNPYSIARLKLISELHHAIKHHELQIHYQAKYDLESGLITGAEALARWEYGKNNYIPPDTFIPLAEQTGLIGQLSRQMLYGAIRQWHEWYRQGYDIQLSLNICSSDFEDPLFREDIRRCLSQWQVPPGRIILEITENTLMETHDTNRRLLESLRNSGVMLSIDDFGTGFSSLAYLRHLPITEIKIDKVFVQGMLNSANDRAIVKTIIDLAHNLGFQVVAEGVEDNQTLLLLQEMGCEVIQGYHIGRPVPADKFKNRLAE
ncbi:MAG: bifunctional diguanylate cyclase/phosphodiesterase [Thiohalophilus sp.]|uniref:putative bifunctional diguanylate cyclase/phosphodiesterase n=1 Tax=Thiohalophilus sp. TaxID=3028392 RepID=UPI0028707136|nr:bifunctional diguanylate cyclase/phosphodiesterase [Thiohalophilus sp.]MDR9435954.1 bifunctional diguanylate cyclase/phosphodiesterase [Thiohalophilus sp.]